MTKLMDTCDFHIVRSLYLLRESTKHVRVPSISLPTLWLWDDAVSYLDDVYSDAKFIQRRIGGDHE